jgi:hypothetical protein
MRNIFWVVGGVAAIYLLSKLRFGQKANFMLRSLRPGGTLLAPTINVEMAVQNPTNQTITIKSITGSVSVNDKYRLMFRHLAIRKLYLTAKVFCV